MIEIKEVILPSAKQWRFVIEGLRSPYNSQHLSDSGYCIGNQAERAELCSSCPYYELYPDENMEDNSCIYRDDTYGDPFYILGKKDRNLIKKLCSGGGEEWKFMRQLPVMLRISAPLYWWKQFDTYKVGTATNSSSTMHTLMSRPFHYSDFAYDNLDTKSTLKFEYSDFELQIEDVVLTQLNEWREKYLEEKDDRYFYLINENLPQSYMQERYVFCTYATLRNIYTQRHDHKLPEWRILCLLIKTFPYADLMITDYVKDEEEDK